MSLRRWYCNLKLRCSQTKHTNAPRRYPIEITGTNRVIYFVVLHCVRKHAAWAWLLIKCLQMKQVQVLTERDIKQVLGQIARSAAFTLARDPRINPTQGRLGGAAFPLLKGLKRGAKNTCKQFHHLKFICQAIPFHLSSHASSVLARKL